MKAKALSPSKKKVASTAKIKPVATTKRKSVSIAKENLELGNQVMDFVEASFKGRCIANFFLDTERTKEGACIVCVAIEGEAGFYKMDWGWHHSYTKTKAETVLMNKKLGFKEEVNEIIISTMRSPIYQ